MKQPAFLDLDFYRKYRKYYTYIEPVVADPLIRGYFTLVASIFLVAFFLFAALSPTFSTILGLMRKIEDQKEIMTKMDLKINNLIVAQENYSSIESKLPLLEKAIPLGGRPDEIFKDIYRVATLSGVLLGPVSLSDVIVNGQMPGVKTGDYVIGLPLVKFITNVSGSEGAVNNFLAKMEMSPRIMKIQTLSYSQATILSFNIKMDLTGITYFYEKSK